MARFNDQEVAEKAADIYAVAEKYYKGSEINTSTLMTIAKEYFDFDEEQLQQLGEYFEWEELSFIPLEDINLDALQYVDPEQVKTAIENRNLKGIKNIEAFLTNVQDYDEEAQAILSQLLTTFRGLTQKEESLEEVKLEETESNKITYKELKEIFTNINKNKEPDKYGVIVFTEDSFTKPYSLESRSYKVSSDNKVFKPDALGYSLYGSALDGSDDGVRLESYMKEEQGGSNGWKVDYCYILDNEKEVE